MKNIKLTYSQVSFLFNNMDVKLEGKWVGTWPEQLTIQLGDFFEHEDTHTFDFFLEVEDCFMMTQTMKSNIEEILRQLGVDALYGTLNDTSTNNSMWCLGMTSDIIKAINNALNNR